MTRLFIAALLLPLLAVTARAQTGRVQVDTFSVQREIDERSADQVWNCQRMSLRVSGKTDVCLEERYSWDPQVAAAASDRLHIILGRLDQVSAQMKAESDSGMLQDSVSAVHRAYQLLDSLRLAGPPAAYSFERALEESVDAYTQGLIGARPSDTPDGKQGSRQPD
ncbi:MAG: hypothetical protein HY700_09225 [Gemmatimonadetes bacterium]|nr:hypothetical protein [Gemmatimonadota bacterium]